MSTNNQYPLSFTGTGGEFFRIWIVNIALTLVTFGIYSAWAKVRTKRWFYGHAFLDQQTFSYHATPIQIFKGRLIAVAFLAVYFLTAEFAPRFSLIILLAIYLAMPWIIVQSLKFKARNSSYRGIRFAFTGSMGDSYKNFLLLPLLIFVSLGIAIPYVMYRQTKFIVDHYQYGQTTNQLNATSGEFWHVYGVAFLLVISPLLILFLGVMQMFQAKTLGLSAEITNSAGMLMTLGATLSYLSSIAVTAYIKVNISNVVYNNSQFGQVSFVANQRVRDVIWIYISNFILIGVTLGIFIPWAKVRLTKYRAEHLTIASNKDLEGFAAGNKEQVSASGDEMADVLDMDFAL